MCTTLHYSFSTKTCGLAIIFKVVMASSKVALVASISLSLEIPNYSYISTWSMRISWRHTHPWILPSFVASQDRRKSHNRSFLNIVHYMLNMLSKLVCLTHLSLLESIFIHHNILWFSFTLNTSFLKSSFSTFSFTSVLPFHFIMVLVSNLERWRIMLETSLFSKSSWRNSSP